MRLPCVRLTMRQIIIAAGVELPDDLLADAEGVAVLIRVTGGNFRLLAQVGRILEINGLGVVSREAVEAAREVLVIGAA